MDENEVEAEKEKTVLVAVASDSKQARLLPYSLANVEELVEIIFYLLSLEIIREDLKAEVLSALEPLERIPVKLASSDGLAQDAPHEERLADFLKTMELFQT